jgi:hypothetical protein
MREDISTDHLFGRAYMKHPHSTGVDGYFKLIDLIRPLLELSGFQHCVSGFYINFNDKRNCGSDDLRLSYFASDDAQAFSLIDEFTKSTGVILFKSECAQKKTLSVDYGGRAIQPNEQKRFELRFRKFLHTYTQIGLDLLEDREAARMLVAEYRLRFFSERKNAESFFRDAFEKSKKFIVLEGALQNQFIKDLIFMYDYPGKPNMELDWAHLMVNMLLPGDWAMLKNGEKYFLSKENRITIPGKKIKEQMDLISKREAITFIN